MAAWKQAGRLFASGCGMHFALLPFQLGALHFRAEDRPKRQADVQFCLFDNGKIAGAFAQHRGQLQRRKHDRPAFVAFNGF